MFSLSLIKRHRLLLPVTALVLAAVGLAPLAFAKVALNTIDPLATLTANGRQVVVTGPIQCDQDQPAELRVTVTQRSTGAVAQGIAHITCAPDIQQWQVRAVTRGRATFKAGPAIAVAFARTTQDGSADDAHQWLVQVTLVRE